MDVDKLLGIGRERWPISLMKPFDNIIRSIAL
jgi:hypothetical protein